jgi:hypothetical protein
MNAKRLRDMTPIAAEIFFRIGTALTQARLLYCDYEGPRAMSDIELFGFGIARRDILMLVGDEARRRHRRDHSLAS